MSPEQAQTKLLRKNTNKEAVVKPVGFNRGLGELSVLRKLLDKLQNQPEPMPEGSDPLCPATCTRWRAN